MGRAVQSTGGGGLVLLVVVAVVTGSVDASADVVMPPPEDCPPGTFGDSHHGGPHCVAAYCPDAGECPDDLPCQPTYLCVDERTGASMLGPFTFEAIAGTCPDGQTCDAGTCQQLEVCYGELDGPPIPQVTPDAGDASAGDSDAGADDSGGSSRDDAGCGCRVGSSPGRSGSLVLLVAAAAVCGLRRRRAILG